MLEPDETAIWRVLDAAANRAAEGLRVVEDYVRFALDDAHLTQQCKQARHDLSAALNPLDFARRHACRDTLADVGTTIAIPSEQRRASAADVANANFQRVEQALRSLEEHAKIVAPQISSQLESLRYRTYTLEKAVGILHRSSERLRDARLYVLIDGRRSPDEFQTLAASLVEVGVPILQLRDKSLSDRDLLARARQLRQIAAGSNTLLIVNDRPDLAVLAESNGVHVGQEELEVRDVRRVVGPQFLVGVSTHSLPQARQAVLDGASYLGVGPTFPSSTKHFDQLMGLSLLSAVAAEIRLPAFAIGGIGPDNLDDVIAAGFRRVAVSSAIVNAERPSQAAIDMMTRLNAAMPSTRPALQQE